LQASSQTGLAKNDQLVIGVRVASSTAKVEIKLNTVYAVYHRIPRMFLIFSWSIKSSLNN